VIVAGLLTCVALVALLVVRDLLPFRPWLRYAELGLWLLFALVVLPALVRLVT
jgi:hypothetical protein